MHPALRFLLILFAVVVVFLLCVRLLHGQPTPTSFPTTIPAIPVVPVTPSGDLGNQWTPQAVYSLVAAVIVLIAVVLLPAIAAYKKATQNEVRIAVAEEVARSAKEQGHQNAVTSERQQGVLDQVQQKLPPDGPKFQ